LEAVLQRLQEMNLTLNLAKCEYNKPSIEFYGYIFSKDGVSQDPKKVEAFQVLHRIQRKWEAYSGWRIIVHVSSPTIQP
jgi:hypothetical protein